MDLSASLALKRVECALRRNPTQVIDPFEGTEYPQKMQLHLTQIVVCCG
jgi:hypothetical protein